jgi:hypothetical protein
LDANWNVLERNGKKLLVMRRSTVTEPIGATAGFEEIAAAESRAVRTLSRRIAAVIKTVSSQQ